MLCAGLLDLCWMTIVAGKFYKGQLGTLLRPGHALAGNHWVAIVLIYLAIAVGIYFFVLPLATTLGQAMLYGALFGVILYGLYELTNYALLVGWPLSIVILDTAWGAVICAAASAAAYFLKSR